MLENRITDKRDIPYIDSISGLACFKHKPTGKFLLLTGGDIRHIIHYSIKALDQGTFHNPTLQSLYSNRDELDVTYTYCPDPRALCNRIMEEHLWDDKILNKSNWPKLPGAFKMILADTGEFYVGTTQDLIRARHYQGTLLRTGKHKSPDFQKKYDLAASEEAVKWEWVICRTKEHASEWIKRWKTESPDLCLNSDRFHGGVNNLGTYVMTHQSTGEFYIGSSKNIRGRKGYHEWALKKGTHGNKKLQDLYNQEGWLFDFKIFPATTREEAYAMEQELLDKEAGNPRCLNFATDVRSPSRELWKNQEYRKKVSESLRKKASTDESKSARSKAMLKMWNTPGRRESRSGGGNPFAKKVMVDSILYPSVATALEKSGLSRNALKRKIDNPNDTETYFP